MKYKRQLLLQDPKLAEEFEANEMNEEDSLDETDVSSPKAIERLVRPKRKTKIKENKCTSHSCGSIKSEQWMYDHPQERDSTKISDKLDLSSEQQQLQACSTSPKITKIEQTSPIHIEEWTNQQQSSSTMITPPPTITTSTCDTMNCSCCDYDGQFYSSATSIPPTSSSSSSSVSYNNHYYSPTQSSTTPSQHMTVNVPVVANFQVNVNTTQHGYPVTNATNHHHYNLSRKQAYYYQQQQQQQPLPANSQSASMSASYYRNNYPSAIKYNQPTPSLYHHQHQQYSSPPQTYMENNSHFPMSSHHDFVYAPRQHNSIGYNTLNHQSNGHIYHQL